MSGDQKWHDVAMTFPFFPSCTQSPLEGMRADSSSSKSWVSGLFNFCSLGMINFSKIQV